MVKERSIEISPCFTDSDFATAMRIGRDYMAWLDMDLSFQDIDTEFSEFSAIYGPPTGCFLIAWQDEEPAGGVGLRLYEPGVCEMKRLFVYDRFQGRGIGRRLCIALIAEARRLGYASMRLDTLERMKAAVGLYRSLGFRDIGPYRFNPDPTARYLELGL